MTVFWLSLQIDYDLDTAKDEVDIVTKNGLKSRIRDRLLAKAICV